MVGAVIFIVGIVTTPVTQLLIEYPSRLVSPPPGPDTPNATIPAVQNYRSRVGLAGPRSLDITSFVSAGLVHPSGSLISEVVPVCPSGTCKFPGFESLSLCSKVANITDRIRVGQVPFSTSRDWTTWDNTIDKNPLLLNGTLAYNVSFLDEEDEYFVAPVSFTLYSSRLVRSIAFAEDKTLCRCMGGRIQGLSGLTPATSHTLTATQQARTLGTGRPSRWFTTPASTDTRSVLTMELHAQ